MKRLKMIVPFSSARLNQGLSDIITNETLKNSMHFYDSFIAFEQWRINNGYGFEEEFLEDMNFSTNEGIIKDNFWDIFDVKVAETIQDIFLQIGIAEEVKRVFSTEEEIMELFHYLNQNDTNLSKFIDIYFGIVDYPVKF